MSSVQSFVSWFLTQLPAFLLSDPIKYFVGFFFLGVVISLFVRVINIK